MMPVDLLERVKTNLIIDFDDDDRLITDLIASAIDYAEKYQHLGIGYYQNNPMSETTKQAVIILTSHFYESRDGSTGGFFADSTNANEESFKTANRLLILDRNWQV